MIISIRQLSRLMRMVVIVALFAFISFKVLGIMSGMLQPTEKYQKPVGKDAVKVGADVSMAESTWDHLKERLALFYQIGE